jgi:hypothetical protein
MDIIEYPKALYRDGECRIVDDAEQAAAARAERFDDWAADHERLTAPADADPAPTRDELKARAAELSIEHAPNITTDKLAALVAAAQG